MGKKHAFNPFLNKTEVFIKNETLPTYPDLNVSNDIQQNVVIHVLKTVEICSNLVYTCPTFICYRFTYRQLK